MLLERTTDSQNLKSLISSPSNLPAFMDKMKKVSVNPNTRRTRLTLDRIY